MNFLSDNTTGAAPKVMAALARGNVGHADPYGNDPETARAEAMIRELFEAPRARVLLTGTGTAANSLALAALAPSWGAIYAHRMAHVEVDESNAPEFFTGGAKLRLVDGDDGRMAPAALADALAAAPAGDVHGAEPTALSLTEATERGTVYGPSALSALTAAARPRALGVHLDGTRFANALAATGASPADASWRAGVDILCLGATKGGALGAEAVILFEPERHPGRAWELEKRRKRAGQLFSKMRFVGLQMASWLEDGLWLRLAARANAMAARLGAGLRRAGLPPSAPVEANIVFVHVPLGLHRQLTAAGARYQHWAPPGADGLPDDTPVELRLVCSFLTSPEEVDAFVAAAGG